MAHKYSVILCTLASGGGDVWEDPRGVLEAVAGADELVMDNLCSFRKVKELIRRIEHFTDH